MLERIRNCLNNNPEPPTHLGDLDYSFWAGLSLEHFQVLLDATPPETLKKILQQSIFRFNKRSTPPWQGRGPDPSLTTTFSADFRSHVFWEITVDKNKMPLTHVRILIRKLQSQECLVKMIHFSFFTQSHTFMQWVVMGYPEIFTIIAEEANTETLDKIFDFSFDIFFQYSWLLRALTWEKCNLSDLKLVIEKLSPKSLDQIACGALLNYLAAYCNGELFQPFYKKISIEKLNFAYINWCEKGHGTIINHVHSERHFRAIRDEITADLVDRLQEKTLTDYPPELELIKTETLQRLLDKAPLLLLHPTYQDGKLAKCIKEMREKGWVNEEEIEKLRQLAIFVQDPHMAIRKDPEKYLQFLNKYIIPGLKQNKKDGLEKWLPILSKSLIGINTVAVNQRFKNQLLALKGFLLLRLNPGASDEAWECLTTVSSANDIPSFICQDVGTYFYTSGMQNINKGNGLLGKAQQLKGLDYLYTAAQEQKERKEDISGRILETEESEVLTLPIYLNSILSDYYRDNFQERIDANGNKENPIDPHQFERVKNHLQTTLIEVANRSYDESMQRFKDYLDQRKQEAKQNRFSIFANDSTEFTTREMIYGGLNRKDISWKEKIELLESQINSGVLTKGWFTHRCQDLLIDLHQIVTTIHQHIPEALVPSASP